MLSIAEARSLDPILQQIVSGVSETFNAALARLWLIEHDSECPICSMARRHDPDTVALHLRGSCGKSINGEEFGSVKGAFHRIEMGKRKIGQIAASGSPLLVSEVSGREQWVVNPEWIHTESIRSFAGQPLVFRGKILGVLAVFSRSTLGHEEFGWLRTFADHAAVAIANARGFEELEQLKKRLEAENEYLQEEIKQSQFGEIIGGSAPLRKLLEQVALVADTDATVLIQGESGTGKELVARAIHERSSRRSRPFIKVNCAAIPKDLFESEFFGHVKGSFTGAIKDRVGRFELAHTGGIFLDEIAEIPLSLQPKLLRVLQEKELERVGETRLRKVDVRVIGATNRDLKREVEEGRFREDLYFRLSVFPIELPPLRQRKADITQLALHFLQRSAGKLGMKTPRLTKENLALLQEYPWPGNIRELENVIERATILSRSSGRLSFDLQPVRNRSKTTGAISDYAKPLTMEDPRKAGVLTKEQLREQEKQNILSALHQSKGKVFGAGGAAEILGMKPTTLASRLKALGLRKTFVPQDGNEL